ncbi:hypothetical protein, partial [Microcoleus sp. D3_18a_C4]|uniref:hypothetical protein n=1 Tax=Microcoleus sp. D3_18a_C4 TaxID=3055332 RepID=UPI002FD16998
MGKKTRFLATIMQYGSVNGLYRPEIPLNPPDCWGVGVDFEEFLVGVSQFCIYSASVPARVLYNTRAG